MKNIYQLITKNNGKMSDQIMSSSLLKMANYRMTEWQKDRMTELQNDRMTEWQNDRMTEWQNDEMAEWKNDKND